MLNPDVKTAARAVYNALRNFHLAMHEEIAAHELEREMQAVLVKEPEPEPVVAAVAPEVTKKRAKPAKVPAVPVVPPPTEDDEDEDALVVATSPPTAEPVAKKPKVKALPLPANPQCKGNHALVPPKPCLGGVKADKLVTLADGQIVCQSCKEKIQRALKPKKTAKAE